MAPAVFAITRLSASDSLQSQSPQHITAPARAVFSLCLRSDQIGIYLASLSLRVQQLFLRQASMQSARSSLLA